MSKEFDLKEVRTSIRLAFVEAKLGQKSSNVQSLVFDRSEFTTGSAKSWAKNHGFRNKKIDVTSNSISLRQFDSGKGEVDSFSTKSLATGVSAVWCEKK